MVGTVAAAATATEAWETTVGGGWRDDAEEKKAVMAAAGVADVAGQRGWRPAGSRLGEGGMIGEVTVAAAVRRGVAKACR